MAFGNSGFQWLLVCLGNPGRDYENTRHNIGFMAAAELSRREGVKFNKLRYRALTGEIAVKGQRVLVVKPQTYMNLSGESVKLAGGFYKIPPERVLVISDDVALPLGKLRIRAGGSAGGHNGLKNIIAHLHSDQFPDIFVALCIIPRIKYRRPIGQLFSQQLSFKQPVHAPRFKCSQALAIRMVSVFHTLL